MPDVFIIYKQVYSRSAELIHGAPAVWPPVVTTRLRPLRLEATFHDWLWRLVGPFGEGWYRINRTQADGESAGFHPVWYGYITGDSVDTKKFYPGVKGLPGVKGFNDLWFKRHHVKRRGFQSKFRRRKYYVQELPNETVDDEMVTYPYFERTGYLGMV